MAENRRDKLARELEHRPTRRINIVPALQRGLQSWVPDVVGLPGDVADAAIYAGRRVARGQSEAEVPTAGLGAASRRWARGRLGLQPPPDTERVMRAPREIEPGAEGVEGLVQNLNPAFLVNPATWMRSPAVMGGLAAALGGHPGMLGVIKNKGGNWLDGSVEGALRGLKTVTPEETRNPLMMPEVLRNQPLNQWIDKQLTRYVKNEMATPEDPVRALAEQGVLHYAPEHFPYSIYSMRSDVAKKRIQAGLPEEPAGRGRLAKDWERVSDMAPNVYSADEFQRAGHYKAHGANQWTRGMDNNPWLDKVAPETKIYALRNSPAVSGELGFGHLIDELSNSLDPASGLPQHLLLDPKSLPRVSVPQAVERVHNINQWRAAQKAEADLKRANNAATVLHKEYPEKGMRWVELKTNREGVEIPRGSDRLLYKGDPRNPRVFDRSPEGQQSYQEAVAEAALRDALKYEGDTMGHCVGGYCDDVLSGKSRIYSLRDAKGQPHITIEVGPPGEGAHSEGQYAEAFDLAGRSPEEFVAWYSGGAALPEDVALTLRNISKPRIVQIKGKGNKKPADDYLPFVQDFVRGGQWSDVGDLHNTGLRRVVDVFNSNELRKIQEAGVEVPQWVTPEDIDQIAGKVWPEQWGSFTAGEKRRAYAEGGSVTTTQDNFDQWSDEDLRSFITAGQEPRALQQNRQGQYVDPASEQKRAAAAEELRKGDFGGAFQRGASSIPFGLARLAGAEGAEDASRQLGEDLTEDRKTWKGSIGATLGSMLPAAAWPFARGLTLGKTLLNTGSGAVAEGVSGYGEGHSASQALTQDAPRGAAGAAIASVAAKALGKGINAARGQWDDPEMKYVYDFAKSKGVDLRPGDVNAGGVQRGLENLHVGAVGQGRLKTQSEQLEKALFGDGNQLLKGFEHAEQAVKEAGKALWAPVERLATQGTTRVAPKSARVVLDDLTAKYPHMLNKVDNVQLRSKLAGILDAPASKLPGLSFTEVRELQQAIGPELAKMKLQALNGTITKDEARAMARLYGSLHEDLRRWGQHGSNQKAYNAYSQANEVYKRDFLPFENNELITKWRAGKYDANNEALLSDLLRPSNKTQQGQLLWYLSQADHDATGYLKMLQAADRAGITLAKGLPEQSVPLGIATLISPKVVAARAAAGAASGHPIMAPLAGARAHLLPDTAYSRPISRALRGGLGMSVQELMSSKED